MFRTAQPNVCPGGLLIPEHLRGHRVADRTAMLVVEWEKLSV